MTECGFEDLLSAMRAVIVAVDGPLPGSDLNAWELVDTGEPGAALKKFDYLSTNPSKSGVFSDSLAFDQPSLDSALRSHLTTNFGGATDSAPMVGGGSKFYVRGPMTGPSGKSWHIASARGVDPDGTVRLITATP